MHTEIVMIHLITSPHNYWLSLTHVVYVCTYFNFIKTDEIKEKKKGK